MEKHNKHLLHVIYTRTSNILQKFAKIAPEKKLTKKKTAFKSMLLTLCVLF